MIKKDVYEIDIFIRFDKKYKNKNISDLTEKILMGGRNFIKIHGSRDYFKILLKNNLHLEIVPVIKILKPKEAENITDLSYSHVKYINKKIKNKKILNEIKIAKAFCYANKVYGAESYVRGFSGYSIELLINYYKGFLNFIKVMAKQYKNKIIIDMEKSYKDKKEILLNINEAKLKSPIILIDPTFKQRNVLAALSNETFNKFREICKKFLRNPSIDFFNEKKIDFNEIKEKFKGAIFISIKTDKQEGDIAGAKLLKFYNHLCNEINKYFLIKNKGFEYNGQKIANFFLVAEPKKEILLTGPYLNDETNVKKFKLKHKSVFEKNGRIYAKEKYQKNLKNFINNWCERYYKKIKDMGITDLNFIY